MLTPEVITAGFATATALIGLVGVSIKCRQQGKMLRLRNSEVVQAQSEMRLQAEALSFASFLQDWNVTSKEFERLIAETEIDRIMIFRAWNGALTPKWTTAVLQMRESGQAPVQYVHFELDQDYIERLRKIINDGHLSFTVEEIPDSAIRAVYEAEGVRSTYWAYIGSERVIGGDAMAITYISFSSHEAKVLPAETKTRCMILTGRLKGIASSFKRHHEMTAQEKAGEAPW